MIFLALAFSGPSHPYLYHAQAVCVGVQGADAGFLHAFKTEEGPVVSVVLPAYIEPGHGVYLRLREEGWIVERK